MDGGGCNLYYFKDRNIERKFYEYCRSLPSVNFQGMDLEMDEDMFISKLVEEYEREKEYKRWCKKNFVFHLKSDKEGEFRTIPKKNYTLEQIKEYLYGEYSDVDYILNEKVC